MTRRPMNMFFPFSVTISTVVTVLLVQQAVSAAECADRDDRLHHARHADGAGGHGTLVPGGADERKRALGASLAPERRRTRGELELEFAALAELEDSPTNSRTPESWSVALAGDLRRSNSGACAGACRGGRIRRGRHRQRRGAHTRALDRFRNQRPQGAHTPFAPQRIFGAAGGGDGTSHRSQPASGRSGPMRGMT